MFRKVVNSSIILVFLLAGFAPAARGVQAQESHPGIVANVTGDWVEIWGLGQDDSTARLEVIRGEGEDIVCSQDYAPVSGRPWLNCPVSGIEPGDLILLYVNGVEVPVKEHLVLGFTLDEFDPVQGEFAGTAPYGKTVFVSVCNPDQDCFDGSEPVNPDGSWIVSFGTNSVSPDAGFWATIWEDDGDSTQASYIYPPNMDVNVSGDWISVRGFGPDDQSARLEVWRGTGPDLMCEGDFDLSEGDPWLECWEQSVDILPGDEVLLFVDGVEIKDHIVLALTLEEVNLADGYFAGTAPMETTVRVDVCDPDWNCISAEDGTEDSTIWAIFMDPNLIHPDSWFAAFISDDDGDQTMAELYQPEPPPMPAFTVQPDHGWVCTAGWEIGEWITLTIAEDEELNGIIHNDYQQTVQSSWDENVGEVCFNFPDKIDLVLPGQFVSVAGNEFTKESWIEYLVFDKIDPGTLVASGYGTDGGIGHVYLELEDGTWFNRGITIPSSGAWTADFGDEEIDLVSLVNAHVVVWDGDGDETMAHLDIPGPDRPPYFMAYPDFDRIDGSRWPMGETVTLVIDDDEDPTNEPLHFTTGIVGGAPWNDQVPWISFDLSEDVDIQPGHWVIMFTGDIFKIHQVQELAITDINPEADTVSGSAVSGAEIMLRVDWDPGTDIFVMAEDGSWFVDYTGLVDLQPGSLVIAGIYDDDGDGTLTEQSLPGPSPLPAFTVQPDHGWVCTGGWQDNETVTLTIAEDEDLNGVIVDNTQQIDGDYCFDFYDIADQVHPGQFVSVVSDEFAKNTWIEYLVFDKIDPETLVASGYGTDGGTGHVYLEMEDGAWFNRGITIPSSGAWTADFGGEEIDLESLVEAHVVIWDNDGDETMAHLDVEDPLQSMFGFNPEQEIINAVDWPMGTVLTLEVDNPATSEVDYTDSGEVTEYAPWNPEDTLYVFDTSGYPALPGYLIKIYGSDIYKQTIVTSLTIDAVDYGNNQVLGSTGSDSFVNVWALGPSPEFYTVLSDQDGFWDVSFSKDLIGFDFILFIEPDDDGDTTELMYFPNSPPVAEADSYSTDEDTALLELSAGVLANDSDPEGSVLSAVLVSDVQHGSVILNPDGSFSYTPDQDYFGPDSFSYIASDGERDSMEALVTLTITSVNDVPEVVITSLADGKDSVLTGLEVDLVVSFTDPDDDTHTAVIDWGDGSQAIDPALSPLTVFHVYQTAGIYPITVTVTDDDGGAGSAAANITVVDPAEAAQSAIEDLESILTDPDLDPEVADALDDAIVELEGANDGASSSGAIDKIDGGQWNAALVKIAKAIQDLEAVEDSDPTLDFSATKETLALIAKSVALDVIELAEALASSPDDLAVIQQAYELIAQGQALLDSGDYLGAVDKFKEALGVL